MKRCILAMVVVILAAPAAKSSDPWRVSAEIKEGLPSRASANGKYATLLRVLDVPQDRANYGEFRDWGLWNGQQYAGYTNIPPGHWVYLAPRWYIWKDQR